MAIIEATPVTDFQGGLIALGLALALLVLRGWLTRLRRRRHTAVVELRRRPIGEAPVEYGRAGGDEEDASAVSARRAALMGTHSAYDGRH